MRLLLKPYVLVVILVYLFLSYSMGFLPTPDKYLRRIYKQFFRKIFKANLELLERTWGAAADQLATGFRDNTLIKGKS